MGHIQVAAEDHGLFLLQLFEISQKSFFPLHPVIQAFQAVLGVGRVDGDQIKFLIFQGNDPSLMVVLRDSNPIGSA